MWGRRWADVGLGCSLATSMRKSSNAAVRCCCNSPSAGGFLLSILPGTEIGSP